MRNKFSRTISLSAVLLTGLVLPVVVAAPVVAEEEFSFNLSAQQATAGGSVTVGFGSPEYSADYPVAYTLFTISLEKPPLPGQQGAQVFASQDVRIAAGSGDWSASFTIPADTPPSSGYRLCMDGWDYDAAGAAIGFGGYGCASFTVTPPVAAPAPAPAPDELLGTVETESGGVALPGGGDSVAPGAAFRARISAGAGEEVTITVTLPGTPAPGIVVAGAASRTTTTDAEGNAFFSIRVPRGTPAGMGHVIGTNSAGHEIFRSEFLISGRAVHPAAG